MSNTPRFEKIEDYGPYDGTSEFTLAQASFLWCGYKPPAQVMKPPPFPTIEPLAQDCFSDVVKNKAIKPIFPDKDYPPDVFAMNQEIQTTLNKYWRSIAGIVNGLGGKNAHEVEERLRYNYLQWGELYPEFILNIAREMKIQPADYPVVYPPIQPVAYFERNTTESPMEMFQRRTSVHLSLPLRNHGITEFDFYDARARLFNRRCFSRKVLLDYARKRSGSVPLFLLSPNERSKFTESDEAEQVKAAEPKSENTQPKDSNAKIQNAIPKKGFHVIGDDYSTVWMNGKQYALSTENRRQIVAVLHKKGCPMKLADLNEAVKGYSGRNIVADSFKNVLAIKDALLKNHPNGHWQLR